MKRHWIVVEDDREIVSETEEVFLGRDHLKFSSEIEAEWKARDLAEKGPGKKYSVFALASTFVINVMTEERAQ